MKLIGTHLKGSEDMESTRKCYGRNDGCSTKWPFRWLSAMRLKNIMGPLKFCPWNQVTIFLG